MQWSIQDLLPLMQRVHLDPLGDLYLWVLGPYFSENVFHRPVQKLELWESLKHYFYLL